MKKVTALDSENKNYEEYENFENDYETSNQRDGSFKPNQNHRSNTYGNNFNPRINQHYAAQTGGNYYDPKATNRRDSNPYQSTYNDNVMIQHGSQNYNDGRRNDSNDSKLKHERDRACILQCFFQELRMVKTVFYFHFFCCCFVMTIWDWSGFNFYKSHTKPFYTFLIISPLHQTNNEGFPDKHKALHVLTKELRDRELKDFYTDSIQECFQMIDTDSKFHRDNCLYSKTLITCLADRAKMNCADWDGETILI